MSEEEIMAQLADKLADADSILHECDMVPDEDGYCPYCEVFDEYITLKNHSKVDLVIKPKKEPFWSFYSDVAGVLGWSNNHSNYEAEELLLKEGIVQEDEVDSESDGFGCYLPSKERAEQFLESLNAFLTKRGIEYQYTEKSLRYDPGDY